MAQIDDGGSAFPIIPPIDDRGNCPQGYPFIDGGISARDWFASRALEGLSNNEAIGVMGEKPPQWEPGSELVCVKWWATAEARIRFIYADAMLAERKRETAL